MLTVILLVICTATYIHSQYRALFSRQDTGYRFFVCTSFLKSFTHFILPFLFYELSQRLKGLMYKASVIGMYFLFLLLQRTVPYFEWNMFLGTRLSPFVALFCVGLAVKVLISWKVEDIHFSFFVLYNKLSNDSASTFEFSVLLKK